MSHIFPCRQLNPSDDGFMYYVNDGVYGSSLVDYGTPTPTALEVSST